MFSSSTTESGISSRDPSDPSSLDHRLYPTPLSPPYPDHSRDIELGRAMSASSRSALFAFSKTHVVFEDEWLLVVNKPSGVYCESLLSSYSSLLSSSAGNGSIPHSPELHLANRLDRDTSGLMVITKSNKVAAKLVKAFTEHNIRKTYVALCVGCCTPKWKRVRIVSGHGRSKHGAWRVYSLSDVGRVLPGGSFVKNMETMFETYPFGDPIKVVDGADEESVFVVDERAGSVNVNDGDRKIEFMVRAYPLSGRTHQIRLHCQYLGIPIKGDVKYHGVAQWNGVDCECHHLHAETLSFDHPVTGLFLQLRAPLPSWASNMFKETSSR